jgi:hypothetical protein
LALAAGPGDPGDPGDPLQGALRHQQHIEPLLDDDIHIGAHLGLERAAAFIVHRHHHLEDGDIALHRALGRDAQDRAGEDPAGHGVGGNGGLLLPAQFGHVGLVHLDPDEELLEVGEAQQGRPSAHRVGARGHHLSRLHLAIEDRAGHGRDDLGLAETILGLLERLLGLAQLGVGHHGIAGVHSHLLGQGGHRVAGDQALFEQLLISLELRGRVPVFAPGSGRPRPGHAHLGQGLVDPPLLKDGVDLDQLLALGDQLTLLHEDRLHLARRLGLDLHDVLGLHHPRGRHRDPEIAPLNRDDARRLGLLGGRTPLPPIEPAP